MSAAADIEDLGWALNYGQFVRVPALAARSDPSCGIVELSRREDSAFALRDSWWPLVTRHQKTIRTNAMLTGTHYLLDLSDPKFRALALWTKDPGELARWLNVKSDDGKTLLDAWPAVHVVVTLNGVHPELEPRVGPNALAGFKELCAVLERHYNLHPRYLVTAKVGDPLVKYSLPSDPPDTVRKNWSDLDPVYATLAELGFRTAHYGLLDTRGAWKRVEVVAADDGVNLIPFDWTADSVGDREAVAEIASMATKHGIRLVTCADRARIGTRLVPGQKKIITGICLPLSSVNKVIRSRGYDPIRATARTGKGNRNCDCPQTQDIGKNVVRYSDDRREACHGCVYCFVRPKSNKGKKRVRA
jgi:hypothetical protein